LPKKKEEKKEEPKEEQAKVTIEEALETLGELKEWLMKHANTDTHLDGDFSVKAIRAVERATGYINWARGVLKRRARQNSNYSYRRPYKKYYGGGRRWKRRY